MDKLTFRKGKCWVTEWNVTKTSWVLLLNGKTVKDTFVEQQDLVYHVMLHNEWLRLDEQFSRRIKYWFDLLQAKRALVDAFNEQK